MVSVCVNLWFRIYVTSAWQAVSGPLAPLVLPSYVSLPLGFLLLFWSLSDHSCLIQPGLWWCQMACGPFGPIFLFFILFAFRRSCFSQHFRCALIKKMLKLWIYKCELQMNCQLKQCSQQRIMGIMFCRCIFVKGYAGYEAFQLSDITPWLWFARTNMFVSG